MSPFVVVLPTALSAAFYTAVLSTLAARARLQRAGRRPTARPPISILKPIAGLDDELAENLASFARLDYPCFELLLGFADPRDPALPVARAFVAAHPGLRARVIITAAPTETAPNPKVAQLCVLERAAVHDVIVVSDANVRVRPDYLDGLVVALAEPGVGLVTSVVAAGGGETLGALVDAAQLVAYVAPAIVAADTLGLRPIAVGKSMAMRKADLAKVGGFAAVSGVLAEDDVLGVKFRAAGFGVVLSLAPVENRNARGSLAQTFDRHARWAKMRRAIAPRCAVFEPLGSPWIVATAVLITMPSSVAFGVWLLALALQATGAALAATLLVERRGAALRFALVEPLRAAFSLACSLSAFASSRVHWRGRRFRIGPGSTLIPSAPRRVPRAALPSR